MKTKKQDASKPSSQTHQDVIHFLRDLTHPRKAEIEALRSIVLSVNPSIREGIKWKSPSFQTTEHFATMNLRDDRLLLILHSGAKLNQNSEKGMQIADPDGLLKWLAKDRAVVAFESAKDLKAKKAALLQILAEWIRFV